MHDNLSGRTAELAHLTDLIRTSLSLADAAIPLLDEQLHALAEMGIDNLQLEGPRIYSRTAGWSPTFDDEQIIFAAALTMPGGLGCTVWSGNDYTTRYGDSHHEPPVLRDRFVVYDKLPPIVRAMTPGDGRIYVGNRDGDTFVIAPGPTCRLEATNHLDGRIFATPAAVGNALSPHRRGPLPDQEPASAMTDAPVSPSALPSGQRPGPVFAVAQRQTHHRCVNANTPRLLATTTSGRPSASRSATVTCVPTPLSSSIFSAT